MKNLGMGSILKIGALALGVYLIWRAGIFDKLGVTLPFLGPAPGSPTGGGGSTALPPTNGSIPVNPQPAGGGGTSATPDHAGSVQYSADQIDVMVKKAAGGDVVSAAIVTGLGIKYNGHQWNWFREQSGQPPAPGTAGLDNTYTATEYLAYRAGLGLSGVGLGGVNLGGVPVAALMGGR